MDVFKAFFLLIYAHLWTVALCLLNTGYISIFVSHTFKPILKAWETLTHRPELLCKKIFLEISQNSQENTYARVSFLIKLQVSA